MSSIDITETGKKIFLTGVTGFVGMAVLEKILRDQHDHVDSIYTLVRASKGENPAARVEKVLCNPVFDTLRRSHPNFSSKVVAVEGDLSQDGLGLSEEDASKLACEVKTIIHCAASIEFCLPLKEAFGINTLGVVRLLELADKCSNLEGIVHVSTAYVNCNLKNIVIEEKVYPITLGDPLYLVEHIPKVGQPELDSLEKCVLKEYPNTYTFTKALTEHVLVSKSSRWNIAIVRPSIITSAICSPTPGWIHGLAAIAGVSTLIGLGVVDVLPVQPQGVVDVVPVDYVASLVVGAMNIIKDQPGYKVYHATSSCINPLTWEMFRVGILGGWSKQTNLEKRVFPPNLDLIPDLNEFDERIKKTRQRMFSTEAYNMAKKDPAGAKKVLGMVGRIDSSYKNFLFFGINQWIYKAHNVIDMESKQKLPANHVSRSVLATMDWNEYLDNFTSGVRHFVLEKHLLPGAKEQTKEQPKSQEPTLVDEQTTLDLKA
ncbi:cyclin-dependent kinase inhibitor far1 [Entomophthora muscae]|uniref:Cyclin-dependent kinase inhibitor far1 n=1 Tax=Entomophthora muscae TaxID=34485 RepID=A0ACC2UGS6_9FUNG|nr:cyclin-dependent kinase inhibitor far1 [Entomophthora muscae]